MNAKQYSFLQAMLTESTITKACAKAGINRSTAYKYLKNESFKKELEKKRSECIEDTVRYLQGNLSNCNETLVNIINDPKTPPAVKIQAIQTVYSTVKAMADNSEAERQLEELSRIMEELKRRRK